MPRPIEARIDLAALRHNYLVAKRHAGSARAWAVVKANAYGHGLLRAAAALGEVADGFALLDLDERPCVGCVEGQLAAGLVATSCQQCGGAKQHH